MLERRMIRGCLEICVKRKGWDSISVNPFSRDMLVWDEMMIEAIEDAVATRDISYGGQALVWIEEPYKPATRDQV